MRIAPKTDRRGALSRRRLLGASAAAGGLAALRLSPALAALEVATPAQTAGPFYPATKPLDRDNDLTVVAGRSGRAQGTPLHLMGRVMDAEGRAVRGAVVEIWQADAHGRYHHPGDSRDVPTDPNFQGYGHDRAGDDGAYRFLTIRPPPYPASGSWMRPAHIHFAVHPRDGDVLVTQMYFAGDPHLARDHIFNRIRDPAARASVVVSPRPAPPELEPAAEAAVFDIVLGRAA